MPLAVTLQPSVPPAPGNPRPFHFSGEVPVATCKWSHTGVLRAWPLPLACSQDSRLCCSPVFPLPQSSPARSHHVRFVGLTLTCMVSSLRSRARTQLGPGVQALSASSLPLWAAPCSLGAGASAVWATSSVPSAVTPTQSPPPRAGFLTWKVAFKTWLPANALALLWAVSCRAPGPSIPRSHTPVRKDCPHPPRGVRGWVMDMVMQLLSSECGFAEMMNSVGGCFSINGKP